MTTKRKILMITPYIPRLHQSGGQRHSFFTIKYLSQTNDITLICYSRNEDGLEELKKYCHKVIIVKRGSTWSLQNILHCGFSLYPFLLINYINSDFRKAIETEINTGSYDLIHCDCLYPMPNIPKVDIPLIMVDVTIEYAIYQHYVEGLTGWKKLIAPILWIDVLKLKYWETKYWKETHTVMMFSQEDRDFVTKSTNRHDIHVFEDAVDPEYFNQPAKTVKTDYPSILFGISNMKWMQNRESADIILKEYWPKIKQKYPTAKLYIVGRNAPESFGKHSSTDIIVTEADTSGNHDPQYYYEHCWLLLAPMGSGGGTRNKFLEGMTYGLPVITNPEGGMGNIKIKNYHHAIVCPKDEILKNVYKLFDDHNFRQKMGQAAKKLIQTNYSFDQSVDKLNQIYDQITHT
ncbi:glycosyltransferase family 4 protein [Candidatus Shapirobacteria bacterium]|nr:glycosyltransferase family 4 protein [Candidatus Shapirobacteria bacterium]